MAVRYYFHLVDSHNVIQDVLGACAWRMQVPRPGWAEHDAEADWWGDLVAICRELVAQVPAGSVRALACSAIGPCMLPVDEEGTPLTNAVSTASTAGRPRRSMSWRRRSAFAVELVARDPGWRNARNH